MLDVSKEWSVEGEKVEAMLCWRVAVGVVSSGVVVAGVIAAGLEFRAEEADRVLVGCLSMLKI